MPEPSIDQLVAELDREYTGTLPEEALREAQRRREEITPHLVQLIQKATETVRGGENPRGDGHLFALFLLTEFQAKETLPTILQALSLPDEGPFDLFGDAITEDLSGILAALAGDSPELLDELIANRSLNEYVRWEAAQAYLHLVRDGRLTRNEAVERLRGPTADGKCESRHGGGQWSGRGTRVLLAARGSGRCQGSLSPGNR